jgi:hypothetical protein
MSEGSVYVFLVALGVLAYIWWRHRVVDDGQPAGPSVPPLAEMSGSVVPEHGYTPTYWMEGT